MVNTHFQTFIEDIETITALDELQKKKNFKSRSQLTKESLKDYLKHDEMNQASDIIFEQMKNARINDFIQSITHIEEYCKKVNGYWRVNRTNKDNCHNINCLNPYCISIKINKMVKDHFNKEEKKFINSEEGKKWKGKYINEFNFNYSRGDFEPGNNTTDYKNHEKTNEFHSISKINQVEFWLKIQTHSLRNTSSRQ